jgi:hypothetical protein
MESTSTDATDETTESTDSPEERRTTAPEHDMSQYDAPDEAPDELLEEIDEERERRLDPENRPDGAEIDNTDRDFDVKHGRFEDSDVDEELGPFTTEDEA